MTRAFARIALAAMAGLMLVYAVEPPIGAWACSCAAPSGVDLTRPLTPAEAAAYGPGAVVFNGRAVARRDGNPLSPIVSSADPITWTFAVERVVHGGVGAVVDVESARDGASCGMTFAIGARYQVVATSSGGTLRTGLCSRTMRLSGTVDAVQSTARAALEKHRESIPLILLALAALTVPALPALLHRGRGPRA